MADVKENIEINKKEGEEILHEVKEAKTEKKGKILIYLGAFLVIGLGVVSGYLLSQREGGAVKIGEKGSINKETSKGVYGSENEEIFKDVAEGKLEKGGIDGEGSHKLIRPGGKSQTVYLTSSVIDLDKFVGKKVKVWGETFAAEKAGWLMDVGRLKVL